MRLLLESIGDFEPGDLDDVVGGIIVHLGHIGIITVLDGEIGRPPIGREPQSARQKNP